MNPLFSRPLAIGLALSCFVCAAAFAQTAISVDATSVIRPIDDRLFGVNTAVWDGSLTTAKTTQRLQEANIRTLRFPGGSTSDVYNWQTDPASKPYDKTFDDFAGIVAALHSQAVITINYGTGTVQLASDWVKYSNVTKGYGIKYWEIGNENYGSWEADNHPVGQQWDPVTYANSVKDYIAAMKAIDSSIKIGVVAEASEDALDAKSPVHQVTNPRTGAMHSGWTPVMLTTLRSLGVTPDFLIYHRYDGTPGQESDSLLLQAPKTWPNDAAVLRQMLNDYLGAAGPAVELQVTENNSVYTTPGKQSTSLVNGLYLAESAAQVMQTEFNAFYWWDLHNGQETGNNNNSALYGWRQYGDYGIMDGSGNPYPTYYVMKLLSHFARGGDNLIKVTDADPLLSAYGTLRVDGTMALLVVNKSATATASASFSLTGFVPAANGLVYSYGIPQDDAAKNSSGSPDLAVTSLANAASTFTASFAPYSVSVIVLAPQTPVVVQQPAGQDVAAGASATFSVTAMGNVPLTYQWNFNGAPITGATSATYSVANVQPANVGSYSVTVGNAAGTFASVAAPLTVTGGSPPANTSRLVNVSSRAQVGTGSNIIITGFVFRGPSDETKKLLVRGMGPSLNAFLSNVLAQPTLSIFSATTPIASNTGWATNADASDIVAANGTLGAVPFLPGSVDSALLQDLSPVGPGYTVEVAGVNNTTGNALAEVYEVDTTDAFPIVNISTRAFVGTGDNILIAGFVVVGPTPARFVVRADGPLLTSYGVPSVLRQPALSVFNQTSKSLVAANRGWASNSAPEQITAASHSVGAAAFAYGNADSELYITLQPGAYTAQVTGTNGTTGVSLVEVYLAP